MESTNARFVATRSAQQHSAKPRQRRGRFACSVLALLLCGLGLPSAVGAPPAPGGTSIAAKSAPRPWLKLESSLTHIKELAAARQPPTTLTAPTNQRLASVAGPATPGPGDRVNASAEEPALQPEDLAVLPDLGLDGLCPVCVTELNKWVRGKPEYQQTYDGKTYHFPGPEQLQKFRDNPARYVPALGGDCTVCWANLRQRLPGSIYHTITMQGKLYLFPNEKIKQAFQENPRRYYEAALAWGGACAVSRTDLQQQVKGSRAYASVVEGREYRFRSRQQWEQFLANPDKYLVRE